MVMAEDYTCEICGHHFESRTQLDLHVRKAGFVE